MTRQWILAFALAKADSRRTDFGGGFVVHTFDIRFDRATGLAVLLGTPANRFGWTGCGRLSIDAQGLDIAVRRGLRSLLARRLSRRIAAEHIRAVYREGDGLRVEFSTGADERAVLPFWARDRETAARIVQLLPTTHTVEMEETSARPAQSRVSRGRLWLAAGAAAAVAVAGLYVLFDEQTPGRPEPRIATAERAPQTVLPSADEIPAGAAIPVVVTDPLPPMPERASPSRDAVTSTSVVEPYRVADTGSSITSVPPQQVVPSDPPASSASRAPDTDANVDADGFVPYVPPMHVSAEGQVIPIARGTVAHDIGSRLMRQFEGGAAELAASYRVERQRFDSLSLDAAGFATKLDAIERRWRDLALKLLDGRESRDPALTGLRASLLAVVTFQSAFLSGYADGLRAGDPAAIEKAFDDQTRADEMLAHARLFVR